MFLFIAALCSPPCQFGGRCVRPNVCHCSPGFLAPYCRRKFLVKTTFRACLFPQISMKTYLYHKVQGGPLRVHLAKRFIQTCDLFFAFLASCNPTCLNGGVCVGPNKCRCPKGYTGNNCLQGTLGWRCFHLSEGNGRPHWTCLTLVSLYFNSGLRTTLYERRCVLQAWQMYVSSRLAREEVWERWDNKNSFILAWLLQEDGGVIRCICHKCLILWEICLRPLNKGLPVIPVSDPTSYTGLPNIDMQHDKMTEMQVTQW